jgi:general L-amino acid transport system permease protein
VTAATAVTTARVPPWRDVRVLKWVVQIVVVAIVVAIIIWLYGNYVENTSRQNIPTDLAFLDNPAAFQIPGNAMSQNAPVSDALYQGFLNTLRVSIVGIILATALGTLVGIGRLSTNWIVSKLATVYVEIVRNIPLALLLVAAFVVIVLGVFPTIQDAWTPLGLFVVSNRGISGPWYEGTSTILVAAVLVGAVAWGLVAWWRGRVADRTGNPSRSALWGGAAFVVVFALGWLLAGASLTTPDLDGRVTTGGIRIDPSFFALLLALVVYTASHIAEIVRGSIQAVHRGQAEAADAIALTGFQKMWYVVLPQAFRIAIPPIGNQYLNLIKNSSLGAAIGYYDLTLVTQTSVGNGSPAVPAFALAMVVYIGISLVTSLIVNLANRRMALVER